MPDRTPQHWFEEVASFLGPAYLRYSFTKGTTQEVDGLLDLLDLQPGQRLLDVGCGPGRHAIAFAEAGIDVVGVDVSADFVDLATQTAKDRGVGSNAVFEQGDARELTYDREFDAVISLCQGAFGLAGGPPAVGSEPPAPVTDRELDEPILAGMAKAVRPGGVVAVSAFSAYFQVRYLEDHDSFEAESGINHERTSIRNEEGNERPAELWTTCFTPRELRLLARLVGLEVLGVYGVTPGRYERADPGTETPEFLLLATRPR